MNWVSPIKDEETLIRFKEKLRQTDDKYYILFEIGVGTGLQLQEILKFRNQDIRGKDRIEAEIGVKQVKKTFEISEALKKVILNYTDGKDPKGFLIQGSAGSETALSREQVYRVLRRAGKSVGLDSIGAQTMRKTFAWRYYKKTKDIYYLQRLLNHASPSITYRYIGEKPNVQVRLQKLTSEENKRSRFRLYQEENGRKRIRRLKEILDKLERELDNPTNNDAFYGKTECFLDEMEQLAKSIMETEKIK